MRQMMPPQPRRRVLNLPHAGENAQALYRRLAGSDHDIYAGQGGFRNAIRMHSDQNRPT